MQMCAPTKQSYSLEAQSWAEKTCITQISEKNTQLDMDTNCQPQCARTPHWWCHLPWQSSLCGRLFGWHQSSFGEWTSRSRPATERHGHLVWGLAPWSPLGSEFCRTGRSPPAPLPGGYHPAQNVSSPAMLSETVSPQQPATGTQGRSG